MRMIEYCAHDSFLHRLDPRVKIIALFFFSAVMFIISNVYVIMGTCSVFFIIWMVAKLPFSSLLKYVRVVLGMMVFLVVVQAIFYPGTTYILGPISENVWLIGGMGVKLEGILICIPLTLRLVALMILMPMVILTTPINMIALGLCRLGLPYKLAYMATTALNLVPTLEGEIATIIDAKKLRGVDVFDRGTRLERLKAYPALIAPLVIGSMRRAQMMGVAMDSRAFGASKHRTYVDKIAFRANDYLVLIMVLIFGAVCVYLNIMLV